MYYYFTIIINFSVKLVDTLTLLLFHKYSSYFTALLKILSGTLHFYNNLLEYVYLGYRVVCPNILLYEKLCAYCIHILN